MTRAAVLLSGHPRKLALLLGALAACGFEPVGLWPLALLALAGLIALIARAPNRKQAALIGWLFGLSHFALGLNWIATAFTYQTAMPPWLGWIAVVLLALYLAVYPALAAAAAWHARRSAAALVLAFAGAWIVSEWLRGWVFTGFPWNPLGVVLLGPFDTPGAARLAPWLGTYALSGLVVALAGLWWIALAGFRQDRRKLGLLLVPLLLQFWPANAASEASSAKRVPFVLIQPDIGQEVLNDPAMYEENFRRTALLSRPLGATSGKLVLWPESGVPWYLVDGYPQGYYFDTYAADPKLARERIGRVIGPGSMLLTGTVDLELRGREAVGARNSVTAIDSNGVIRGSYDKAHLVPYGEYLPMRGLLEPLGLARLVPGAIDFWPGPGPRTLDLGGFGKAGVQVCYEIVFSGEVVAPGHRPDYIFNPSNDGWFGAWGPPQHLAQARLRAIEEGLPVLRSTTTGISAVIDAHGRVNQWLPRGSAGRLEGQIPPALPPPLFARLGNVLALGWAAVLLALSLVASRRWQG